MKNYFLLLIVFTAICTTSFSQTSSNTNKNTRNAGGSFDFDMRAGIPINAFGTATDAIPFGLMGAFFYQPTKTIPIQIGFDLGYMNYGNVRQEEVLDVEIAANGSVIDEFIIPLEINTSNNIFDGHLVLRAIAPLEYFKPYIEGVFGFHNFWTATTVRDKSEEHYLYTEADNDVISTATQINEAALSYGVGGGFIVEITQNVGINLRADYLRGGRMRWFDEDDTQSWTVTIDNAGAFNNPGDIAEQNINVNALATESVTDMVTVQAGLIFTF